MRFRGPRWGPGSVRLTVFPTTNDATMICDAAVSGYFVNL